MFVPSFGASLALRAPCPANCAAMPRPGEGRRSAEPVWRSGRPSAYPAWKDGGTTGPRPRTSRPLSGYGVKAMSAALTPAVGSIPSQLRKDYHPGPRQGDVRPRQLHRAHRHQDVPRRPPLPVAAPHQRRFRRPAAPVFPREPTCRAGARQTPRTSPTHSITVPGRSSATRLRPRCSTSSCNQCGQHSIDPPGTAYRLSNLVIGSALTAPITLDEIACGHRLRAGSRLCAASCDAPHQPTSDPCR